MSRGRVAGAGQFFNAVIRAAGWPRQANFFNAVIRASGVSPLGGAVLVDRANH